MRVWLRKMRLGRTQTEVGEAAGISQVMVSRIERGEKNPSIEVAKRLAAVLGFEWTRFYEEEAEEPCG